MSRYSLHVAGDNSAYQLAGKFDSIRQAVLYAKNCYGKGVKCSIVDNEFCEVVKQWILRK